MSASQRPGYFDALYAADPDPWGFETRAYERAKYDATLAALPSSRYASALEVGCSIGVLTERLAARCDTLLGIDIADAALARARERCGALDHVRFATSHLPAVAPAGPFDLVMLSEVLYYFDAEEIAVAARALCAQMGAGATAVLVHWLGPTPDYPMTGDTAVAAFEAAAPQLHVTTRRRTAHYRLDVLAAR